MKVVKIIIADVAGFVVLMLALKFGFFITTVLAGINIINAFLSIKILGSLVMCGWMVSLLMITSQLGAFACAGAAAVLSKNDDSEIVGHKAITVYTILFVLYCILCIVELYIANGFVWWLELPFAGVVFSTVLNIAAGGLKR